ncbi:hypothetical protein M406DRAFT_326271 [Cryphonectria parasitica EP155]|uniref:Uncharacterized protein n=1 Tax=Cryphonectria parasitica (strain ATCC 38755 / EP155) TaxID=660469 RepID=A0A9P5CTP5_CRYP1|nr:uncharacterized protein M406DRAFT_326271 [Cryphonectria parasitica EP155]KAF3770854.1 hypothetical protein M406DRAFT_326271 [Cryphonectria parasitica EP155]
MWCQPTRFDEAREEGGIAPTTIPCPCNLQVSLNYARKNSHIFISKMKTFSQNPNTFPQQSCIALHKVPEYTRQHVFSVSPYQKPTVQGYYQQIGTERGGMSWHATERGRGVQGERIALPMQDEIKIQGLPSTEWAAVVHVPGLEVFLYPPSRPGWSTGGARAALCTALGRPATEPMYSSSCPSPPVQNMHDQL